MALKLMYITKRPQIARIAEEAGVDRIFVDMEYIGKSDRQSNMDTVQCHHTIEDVRNIRNAVRQAELLVRCNPIHDETAEYCSSKEEIDAVVSVGADLIMLPYAKTVQEVQTFVDLVAGRAKTSLLLETPEAVEVIDQILEIAGVDEVFIGLNDLSLGYRQKFMFQPLADGTVERLCRKFRAKGIPYGFGGIASLGKGRVPSEYVIREHYRLGSGGAILSRSFCNTNQIQDVNEIRTIFTEGVRKIREFEEGCDLSESAFEENRRALVRMVDQIVGDGAVC